MKILAIETSCDDTCISVFDSENGFLSNITSSQVKIHKKWGGVYPTLARREHQRNLIPVLKKALSQANLLKKEKGNCSLSGILNQKDFPIKKLEKFLSSYQKPEIDLIAVTIGPGLDPSLWSGINFTKALSYFWNLPVVPVSHTKAHFFAPLILSNPEFPVISLIVSGGHTELILSENLDTHKVIGKTRDDAAGECFDKSARIIGLDYPGGPQIAKMAQKKTSKKVSLPRPMLHSKDFDFSFSGLKTAVLYMWQKEEKKDLDFKVAMAKEIQEAISDVLVKKTFKAVKEYKAKRVVVGGGVSANQLLREKMKQKDPSVILPDLDFSTDNAKMIAITALYEYQKGNIKSFDQLRSKPNLKIN